MLESNGAVLSSESANVTEENERLKKLSEREKRSEESETDVNRSHAKDSVPTKADLISAVEDVGGKWFVVCETDFFSFLTFLACAFLFPFSSSSISLPFFQQFFSVFAS